MHFFLTYKDVICNSLITKVPVQNAFTEKDFRFLIPYFLFWMSYQNELHTMLHQTDHSKKSNNYSLLMYPGKKTF